MAKCKEYKKSKELCTRLSADNLSTKFVYIARFGKMMIKSWEKKFNKDQDLQQELDKKFNISKNLYYVI